MANTANIKAVITAEDKASATLKGFGDNVDGLSLGMKAGLATAGAAIVKFGLDSISAFSKSEDLIAQTNAVLKSTGEAAGVTADQVTQLAASWQKSSTFSHDAVRGAENILLTFTNIKSNIFPQTTQAVLDISTALHEDLQSAAIQVGKALQDPVQGITALKRVGVNFSDSQKEVIKSLVDTGQSAKAQQIILDELNKEFGGSAQAAATTYSGKIAILKNRFNDLEQGVGHLLVNGLFPIVNIFAKTDKAQQDVINTTGKYNSVVSFSTLFIDAQAEAQKKVNNLTKELPNLLDQAKQNQKSLADSTQNLGKNQQVLNDALDKYGQNSPQYTQATSNLAGAQKDYDTKLNDEISTSLQVTTLEGQLKDAKDKLAQATQNAANWQAYLNGQMDYGIKIAGTLHDAIFLQAIPAVDALQGSIHNFQRVVGSSGLGVPISALGNSLQGGNLSVQGHRASGGDVKAGNAYIVGEKGQELFVPSGSGTIIPNGKIHSGGSNITINVNAGAYMGSQIDARKYATQILKALQDIAASQSTTVANMIGAK